jgi:hypothetical protein
MALSSAAQRVARGRAGSNEGPGAVVHTIETGNAVPVHVAPRRVPFSQSEVIRTEVNRMLRMGVIEPSTSSWACALVLLRKKDGTWRFCVDYRTGQDRTGQDRPVNAVTAPDRYPLPRVDDLLEEVVGARFLSTADLT